MLTPELSPPFLSFFNPRAPPSRPYSVISFTNERAASYDFVSRVYARLQTLRVRDSKVLPPPPPSLIHLENRLYGFLDRGGGGRCSNLFATCSTTFLLLSIQFYRYSVLIHLEGFGFFESDLIHFTDVSRRWLRTACSFFLFLRRGRKGERGKKWFFSNQRKTDRPFGLRRW